MSTEFVSQRKIPVWGGRVQLSVQIRGQGPALVYFPPAAGFGWDPFLVRLAENYTIHALEFPGTTPGDPYAIHEVDDLADAVLLHEEALRSINLQGATAIGQSFGGMLALELAAVFPTLFSNLVVFDPIGLWRDDAPVANWIAAAPEELPGLLFRNPASPAAQAALAIPSEPEAAVKATAQLIWNFGATGKMVWPIPDRGLAKRLHRVTTPTLIIWGEQDSLIASSYAYDLARLIHDSRVELVRECGHIPQVEQCEITFRLVTDFLALQRNGRAAVDAIDNAHACLQSAE